jgi:hypothetical protein
VLGEEFAESRKQVCAIALRLDAVLGIAVLSSGGFSRRPNLWL